jgi:hypothetical protein
MTDEFEMLVNEMACDPLFIKACEENNQQWEEEAAAHLEITVDQLQTILNNN